MKLPSEAHTSRPWRIHQIAPDFHLEDVWALPTPGGPDDFGRLVELMAAGNPEEVSWVVRQLFAVRWKLGGVLGWDGPDTGTAGRVPSLRSRLPHDLRFGPTGPAFPTLPFTSLFLADHEWAAEVANSTMHGIMHLGWVEDGDGWRGQMAVLVKPNGWFGQLYMAAIKPFRYLFVYPAMIGHIGRRWKEAMAVRVA